MLRRCVKRTERKINKTPCQVTPQSVIAFNNLELILEVIIVWFSHSVCVDYSGKCVEAYFIFQSCTTLIKIHYQHSLLNWEERN